MRKRELVKILAFDAGLSNSAVEAVVDALANYARAQLAAGGEVLLPGIGKLVTMTYPERNGKNPATGEPMVIRAHRAVSIRTTKALRGVLK